MVSIDFGPSDYVDQYDPALSNFALACPPDSALRRFEQGEAMPELDKQKGKKSFIHSPERANDLCQHPEFQQLHGYTQTNETELTPLIPLYTFAKMKTHSDLLVTPLEQYWDYCESAVLSLTRTTSHTVLSIDEVSYSAAVSSTLPHIVTG